MWANRQDREMKDKHNIYSKVIKTIIASGIAIILCDIALAAGKFERVCLFMIIYLCVKEAIDE